jgi:two-component system sensor histidine kinase KdpD
MASALRRTFDLDAVAVFRRAGPGWQMVAAAGGPLPATPDEAPFQAELTGGDILVLAGSRLTEQDARLLREFITELRLGQERRQLAHISRHPGRPHTNSADQPAPQP